MVLHWAVSLGDVVLRCRFRARHFPARRLLGSNFAGLQLPFLAALVTRLLGRNCFHVRRLSLFRLLLLDYRFLRAFVLFPVMAPKSRLGETAVMLLPIVLAIVGSLAGLGQRHGTQ